MARGSPGALVRRDGDACTRCGQCVAACPVGVMIVDINSNYDWARCRQCGACIDGCPEGALSWERFAESQWVDERVRRFAAPGLQNTEAVIAVVLARLRAGSIRTVVCGSSSGASACKLVDAGLPRGCRVVNISAPANAYRRYGWQPITAAGEAELRARGITSLQQAATVSTFRAGPFHSSCVPRTFRCSRADLALWEVLIDVGGMGLKTAVECTLDACLQGAIPIGERVIGIAGTGRGFDTAAVIRATTPAAMWAEDPEQRLQIEELLAAPRVPRRYY